LEDEVAKIEVPELRRQIEQSLAGQLNESAVLSGALAPTQDPLSATQSAAPRVDGEQAAPAQKEKL